MPAFTHAHGRRIFLSAGVTALASACAPVARAPATARGGERTPRALLELETQVGGRLGLLALDTASGQRIAHRADERFAMCSTFKWLLVAAVLARVDRGQLSLDRELRYGPADLLEYAPVTRPNVARGALSVEALAAAAIADSDNTAANLLLTALGGPPAFTQFARELGDQSTRLDRNEPTLNTNLPGDARDTTTPRAMATNLARVFSADALSEASRARLRAWLEGCHTGNDRLRAGLPAAWRMGHKTGTGQNGALNDVAIAWPPGRAPIAVACYLSESRATPAELSAVHAQVGRIIAAELAA